MNYINYIEENQTWKCPRSGKYKVTCVGGGGTGILYTQSVEVDKAYFYQNGGATSFGSYLTAMGSQIANPKVSCYNDGDYGNNNYNYSGYTLIGGYGGYDLCNYGGNPDAVCIGGGYGYFVNSDHSSTNVNMSFCDRNGGSINEMYAHNTYGAGGYSKARIIKATVLSSLKFTIKAYYNAVSYTYRWINAPYGQASTVTKSETRSLGAGVDTITFAGNGKEFTKASMLPSELSSTFLNTFSQSAHVTIVETSTTTSTGQSGNNTYTNNSRITQPYTRFELTESPVKSTTKNKVELYPIKARNNGSMRVDIIELTEGEEIACSIGAGGKVINAGLGYAEDLSYLRSGIKTNNTTDMSNIIGDGSDGIIVIQYLGA